MLKFEAINPLFSFLNVPMLPRNHSNDFVSWVLVKYVHKQPVPKQVKKKLKESIIGSKNILPYLVMTLPQLINNHGFQIGVGCLYSFF